MTYISQEENTSHQTGLEDNNDPPHVIVQDFGTDNDINKHLSSDEDDSVRTPSTDSPMIDQANLNRPTDQRKMKNSVKLDDTPTEGRPSIYLFIFVNPLSGDKKGTDLVHLPIQHFRLRKFPQVQVEIHNILDEEDRINGIKNIELVETKVTLGQVPPQAPSERSGSNSSSSDSSKPEKGVLSKAVLTRQIHVWSAGGDGTVMSVFELLVAHNVNLDLVFFSCIPFGTGNDFSQVLGWGRTIPEKNILGQKLQHLEELISDRLEKSEAARLDIWQITMTCFPGGYVRQAGPKERKDGHDVAEVKEPHDGDECSLIRKMSNYMSIGVQGFVGSGFEAHRAGNRLANMFVYAHESTKWVFWRRFPDLTRFIRNISQKDNILLECHSPEEKRDKNYPSTFNSDYPRMTNDPIDFVIQNIPHIWGREVDLWGEATSGLESVANRSGCTDPSTWKPQRANDGRLEIMTIENMTSYLKKLANIRDHVSRIGQFNSPFKINFREPEHHTKEVDKAQNSSMWTKTKALIKDKTRHKYEMDNVICTMCDGEFYEIKDPKSIEFNRFAQIWTLGRDDDMNQGRLVTDELDAQKDNEQ
ncbi:ATP-NAD kinase-like domain-containing protein [Helicostylum pulchrum]|nr:ATP-NAD kinase-like domain-containing protein [Helicostylum pulchrum]